MASPSKNDTGSVGADDSYPLVRRLLHAPLLGLVVGSGNAEAEEMAAVRKIFQEALAEEGLDGDAVELSLWPVGRSAAAYDVLLYVGSGAVALAAGIKQTDDAVAVLRKWWRALTRARTRLESRLLTAEALKLACIDDLADWFGPHLGLELDRIVVGAGTAQYQDGTWLLPGPLYIAIPSRSDHCTHLYVVGVDGTILHRSRLPYFPDDLEKFRLGPLSDAAASSEARAISAEPEDWDTRGE